METNGYSEQGDFFREMVFIRGKYADYTLRKSGTADQ